MRRVYESGLSLWGDRPALDYAVAALAVSAHGGFVLWLGRGDVMAWSDAGRREATYETVAAVLSIVFGFSTAAVSYYLSAVGPRMALIRDRVGTAFRRNWVSVLATFLLTAAGCITLLLVDTAEQTAKPAIRWFFEALLLLTAVRTIRLLWLFSNMIGIADAEATERPLAKAPRITFDPDRPRVDLDA